MHFKRTLFFLLFLMLFLFPDASLAWDGLLGERLRAGPDETQAQLWETFALRWERVLQDERERPVFAPGGEADFPPRYKGFWKETLAALRGNDAVETVSAVCAFMDTQFAHAPDMKVYNRPEHWASPAEMAAKGAGDSEDLAFIKYFALRSLGFAAEDLRLLLVDLPEEKETRDVLLAVRVEGATYLQDSAFRPAGLLLRVDEAMTRRYKLLTAFNEDGVWFYR